MNNADQPAYPVKEMQYADGLKVEVEVTSPGLNLMN